MNEGRAITSYDDDHASFRQQLPTRIKERLEVPAELNHTWSMDFVTDVLENKKKFRAFNIIDDYTQNAFIERFNGSYRRGILDKYIFEDIHQVREQTQFWMNDYNHKRPHDSLGKIPPVEYAKLM